MDRSDRPPRPDMQRVPPMSPLSSADFFVRAPREDDCTASADVIQYRLNVFFAGESPSPELCNQLTYGLTLSDSEGREWRTRLSSTWRRTERLALGKQLPNASFPPELRALSQFDQLVLPRFSKLLPARDKSEFIEYGILHLAWVGYEGLISEHHTETVKHATNLIRYALPEGLEVQLHSGRVIERLGRVISSIASAANQLDHNEYSSRNYDALDELLSLPLPWSLMRCEEALCELHGALQYELNRYMDPAERVFLSDIATREPETNTPASSSENYPEQSDPIEFSINDTGVEQYMTDSSEQDIDYLNAVKTLAATLVDRLFEMPLDPNGEFWKEFLTSTSLSDPTWARGVQALERCNPYEFEAITHKLLLVAAHSPYGARTLLALTHMDHTRTWQSKTPFLVILRDLSSSLSDEIRSSIISQIRHVTSHCDYLVWDVIGNKSLPSSLNQLSQSLWIALEGHREK